MSGISPPAGTGEEDPHSLPHQPKPDHPRTRHGGGGEREGGRKGKKDGWSRRHTVHAIHCRFSVGVCLLHTIILCQHSNDAIEYTRIQHTNNF